MRSIHVPVKEIGIAFYAFFKDSSVNDYGYNFRECHTFRTNSILVLSVISPTNYAAFIE